MVTLGHIDYLNCIPVHGGILMKKVPFDGQIVTGTPSHLNKLLILGDVDISPSSSVELIRGHYIVPNLSISSKSEVQSILLFTKKRIEEIDNGTILITSHSATSSLLTKIIFTEFYKINLNYKVFDPSKNDFPISSNVIGMLHIGDIALNYFLKKTSPKGFEFKYDLSNIWYEKTDGLPFTFALWQVTKQSIDKKEIRNAIDSLYKSYEFFLSNKNLLAEFYQKKTTFTKKQIIDYWDNLDFSLGEKQLESLKIFFSLLKKNKFIQDIPTFKFI